MGVSGKRIIQIIYPTLQPMGLLAEKKLFVFDMDGVIYRGDQLIPGAAEFLAHLRQNNRKIAFLTNNSSKTKGQFAQKLQNLGVEATADQIYTSAYISAEILNKQFPHGTVFIVGEDGLEEIFQEHGFNVLNHTNRHIIDLEQIPPGISADFVIVGWDRQVTYSKFRCAMMLIEKGARFFATNDDANFPGPDTLWPGAGALVSFLQTALGFPPERIFGKPNPQGIEMVIEESHVLPAETVMVGDRLTTDILAGNRAHVLTVAVETGIHTREDLMRLPDDCAPSKFVSNLDELISEL